MNRSLLAVALSAALMLSGLATARGQVANLPSYPSLTVSGVCNAGTVQEYVSTVQINGANVLNRLFGPIISSGPFAGQIVCPPNQPLPPGGVVELGAIGVDFNVPLSVGVIADTPFSFTGTVAIYFDVNRDYVFSPGEALALSFVGRSPRTTAQALDSFFGSLDLSGYPLAELPFRIVYQSPDFGGLPPSAGSLGNGSVINGVFVDPSRSLAPFQENSINASMAVDGVVGSPVVGTAVNVTPTSVLELDSVLTGPANKWTIGAFVGVPAPYFVTNPGAQIVNVDFTDPSFIFTNDLATAPPFVPQTIPIGNLANLPASITIQLLICDPTAPDGFWLSQATELM